MTKKIMVVAGLNPHEQRLLNILLDGEAHTIKDMISQGFIQAAIPYVNKNLFPSDSKYNTELRSQANSLVRNALRKLCRPPRCWVYQCGIGMYQISPKALKELRESVLVEYPKIKWANRIKKSNRKQHNIRINFGQNEQAPIKLGEKVKPIYAPVPKRTPVPKKQRTIDSLDDIEEKTMKLREELFAALKPSTKKEVKYAKKAATIGNRKSRT